MKTGETGSAAEEGTILRKDLKRAEEMLKLIDKGILSIRDVDNDDLILLWVVLEKELEILEEKMNRMLMKRHETSDSKSSAF